MYIIISHDCIYNPCSPCTNVSTSTVDLQAERGHTQGNWQRKANSFDCPHWKLSQFVLFARDEQTLRTASPSCLFLNSRKWKKWHLTLSGAPFYTRDVLLSWLYLWEQQNNITINHKSITVLRIVNQYLPLRAVQKEWWALLNVLLSLGLKAKIIY